MTVTLSYEPLVHSESRGEEGAIASHPSPALPKVVESVSAESFEEESPYESSSDSIVPEESIDTVKMAEAVSPEDSQSKQSTSSWDNSGEGASALSETAAFPGVSLDNLNLSNARVPLPSYPVQAKKMEWEGDVTVSFVINEKGRVESFVIEESSGYELLDQAVADMVMKGWRFPRREAPLQVWKTFSFKLI